MPMAHMVKLIVDSNARLHRRWVNKYYSPFGVSEREKIFLSIARFCHINRPVDGYYFEFGCHTGRTMSLCWKHTRHLFNWSYVAFDSFEGLPEIEDIDKQEIWEKGRMMTGENDFLNIVTSKGMPRDRIEIIKGFYSDTLTQDLKNKLLPGKAAVVYIDCDLYASTVPVLEFIKDFLKKGTIVVFDDWNCFNADPELGERRAFREFLQRYPNLHFEPFYQTAEGMCFV